MSYTPQPGTIAYRAIAWLERQPAGHEVTASMWAEAIGYTDGDTLRNCIVPALHAGLVKRRTRDGMSRPEWYSLGDGKPPAAAAPADEDTTDPLPVRTRAPEVKPHAGEVLPGVTVPRFRDDTKAVQAAIDACVACDQEPCCVDLQKDADGVVSHQIHQDMEQVAAYVHKLAQARERPAAPRLVTPEEAALFRAAREKMDGQPVPTEGRMLHPATLPFLAMTALSQRREPRRSVDFAAVPPSQWVMHDRLTNWARWATGAQKQTGRAGQPMFALYRSSDSRRDYGSEVTIPVDRDDALKIHFAILRPDFDPQCRRALQWSYLRPRDPVGKARELAVSLDGLAQLVRQGRAMLIERGV